jgi:spermidine synthase
MRVARQTREETATSGRWWFAAVYTGSGAAGLIYQVIWTRLLSLHFGHTVAAAGTVLAAFMGGLSAGALIAERLTPRIDRRQALRAYAVVELFLAVAAVAFPVVLDMTRPLLARSYGAEPGLAFAATRLATSVVLVFLPALAMGATYPLAIKALAAGGSAGARDAGRLYALNTCGAAAGAILAGFVLIPRSGLLRTTGVAVALNLAAAAVAGWMAANSRVHTAQKAEASDRPPGGAGRPKPGAVAAHDPGATGLAALTLGLSGFAAMTFEVAFTRALAVVLGPTSYAFSAMLAAFIVGLGVGATLASRRAWTRQAATLASALLLVVTAVAAMMAAWFCGTRLPLLIAELVADPAARGADILERAALYAAGVLLPVSCALGALFPVCLRLAVDDGGPIARRVAFVYAMNTFGAVAGSLVSAFVLIPLIGVQDTLRLGALVALTGACVLLSASALRFRPRLVGGMAAASAAGLVVAGPGWSPSLISAGGYKNAVDLRDLDLDLELGLTAGRLLYYREGPAATVSVRRLAGTLALAIDGKVDASNGPDMLTQKLLAHLPLLLHADPHEICIIGLGSGVTLGAALRHPVSRADVVEISPEVVEASSFFEADNRYALRDSRTRLIVGDGRSHLRYTTRRYDVIISEPSNPWMAGVGALFTREFFEAARARLAPGGIFCQWAHTYDLAGADLQAIAATFASVFPDGAMWLVGEGDVLFVATTGTAGLAYDSIARAWSRPGVADDLASVRVLDVFSLLSLYVAGPGDIERYARGAIVETDDRPTFEFSGPLGLYDRRTNDNRRQLEALVEASNAPDPIRTALEGAGAAEWRHRGHMLMGVRDYAAAYDEFARALSREPGNEEAILGLIEAAGATGRGGDARTLLESLAAAHPSQAPVRRGLARLLAAMGALDEAAAHAESAMALDPADPKGTETLASIAADAGALDRLRPLVGRMRQTNPDGAETLYYAALAGFLSGDLQAAVAEAERAVQIDPRHALAHNLIGSASAAAGRRDRAREAFQASLAVDPREPTTYANLGRLEAESGNRAAAIAYFVEALSLDPADAAAREGLAAALASTGADHR